MNRLFAFVISAALILSAGITHADELNTDETTVDVQIKKLIPAATGMSRAEFKNLATSPNPKPSMISAVSLSMELMKATFDADTTEEMFKEFGFGKGVVPKPNAIAKEYTRPVKGSPDLVTAVHLDRITELKCVVSDDSAKGTVSYRVPKSYSGQFKYEAKREQERWRIVRITMPARKIDLIRDEDGDWKNAKSK